MKHHHKGTALITALFMVAIVVIIATAFVMRGRHLVTHILWASRSDKLLLALQGAQDWGTSIIAHAPITAAGLSLSSDAKKMSPFQYHGIKVQGFIKDQQGLFNINNLIRSPQQSHFVRLLKAIDARVSTQDAFRIAVAITGKLTAEKATQRQMTDITELRTIPAISASLYEKLKPYVTAIPNNGGVTPININSATAPVIYSLTAAIRLSQARAAVACVQEQGGFQNIMDYNHTCLRPLKITRLSGTTTSSRFFMINALAKKGLEQRVLQLLLQVKIANQKASVKTIWRTIT